MFINFSSVNFYQLAISVYYTVKGLQLGLLYGISDANFSAAVSIAFIMFTNLRFYTVA